MANQKLCYLFEEGAGNNRKLLGGKGAGLCEMTQLGLPIPPGFVITTEACIRFNETGKLPEELMDEVRACLKIIEQKVGKKFGDPNLPLLLSVRSGAAVSMPGMMDTVLNLGLNDRTVKGLIANTGNPRFAYDVYRRFITLFGKIVLGIDGVLFDEAIDELKSLKRCKTDLELDAEDLKVLTERLKSLIMMRTGSPFPEEPYKQLELAIIAVFKSWNGKRAVEYRKKFRIGPEIANGTAASVQAMVFGNMEHDSATGVAFTRDPATGENVFYGEYLMNAQGEELVAGARTPKPLDELKKELPECYNELMNIRALLERHYREVQDIEFTIERGKLYILQTRNAKMNAAAMVKTSVDMVNEGLLTKDEALMRVRAEDLTQLMHPRLDPRTKANVIARGLPASPGAASGSIVFDADDAVRKAKAGQKVILVREETRAEDIHGFFAAQGILTSHGGMTSHAAVVARGMGKPCVSGAETVKIDVRARIATFGTLKLGEGDIITIDGSTGNVLLGAVPTIEPELSDELQTFLRWADERRVLGVRANVGSPEDAELARRFGCEGIGLCRTERMFNAKDRLPIVQELILADTPEERASAIAKLLPLQREDFKQIFRVMEGMPVTIRLLDPPLHEFLPSHEELMHEIQVLKEFDNLLDAVEKLPESLKLVDPKLQEYLEPMEKIIVDMLDWIKKHRSDKKLIDHKEKVLRKVRALAEINPMLGHRGVRLGISYPEIYEMQVRAILEAASELIVEGRKVEVEIMVPQVCTAQELLYVKERLTKIEAEVQAETGVKVPLKYGTMIEVVRACMRAGKLAEIAEFFSFGTNDLTQSTFSFSREDAENKFLPLYNEKKILQDNPFEILDVKGVGRLMMIAIEWGRKTRPELTIGICGEHGGEPNSIKFCHQIGCDYVSASPYRIPIARLAAAQAAIEETRSKT